MSVQAFLDYVLAQEGAPYLWGARGLMLHDDVHGLVPSPWPMACFDCSGLVTAGLYKAGWRDWRASHNANELMHALARVDEPEPGDFIFYGSPDHASHVEVVVENGRLLGALNGGPHCLKPEPDKARVRYREKSRPDSLGYRRNPLRETK